MTNLIPTNVKIPAHLANRIGKPSVLAQALGGGIGSGESVPRISLKGARFRIKEGENETVLDTTALDIVIVGANPRLSKTWYSKAWTPDAEPVAPDCFSLDGVRPDQSSTDPQNDICATCPHNAWGSKVTPMGQKVKACSDLKRLAVVAADDPTGPIYLLQVTPAALKGLNQYQRELSMRGIAPEIVKTRISFDTDASFPKLVFGFGGFLDEAAMEQVDGLFGSAEVKVITGEEVTAPEAPAPVEKPKPMLVKPKAVAAPVAPVEEVTADDEEAGAVAPEPATPKRGFGAKAAAPAAAAAPAPAARKAAAPKVVAPAATNLADTIADLIANVDADDE
jgi:hypothetical protein